MTILTWDENEVCKIMSELNELSLNENDQKVVDKVLQYLDLSMKILNVNDACYPDIWSSKEHVRTILDLQLCYLDENLNGTDRHKIKILSSACDFLVSAYEQIGIKPVR